MASGEVSGSVRRKKPKLAAFPPMVVTSAGVTVSNERLTALTESDRAYSTVTVQVLPEAVEMLVLAQELGSKRHEAAARLEWV